MADNTELEKIDDGKPSFILQHRESVTHFYNGRSQSKLVCTLNETLKNVVALSYFVQFMESQNFGIQYLQFWLKSQSFRSLMINSENARLFSKATETENNNAKQSQKSIEDSMAIYNSYFSLQADGSRKFLRGLAFLSGKVTKNSVLGTTSSETTTTTSSLSSIAATIPTSTPPTTTTTTKTTTTTTTTTATTTTATSSPTTTSSTKLSATTPTERATFSNTTASASMLKSSTISDSQTPPPSQREQSRKQKAINKELVSKAIDAYAESVRQQVENDICQSDGPGRNCFKLPQELAYVVLKRVYYPRYEKSFWYTMYLSEQIRDTQITLQDILYNPSMLSYFTEYMAHVKPVSSQPNVLPISHLQFWITVMCFKNLFFQNPILLSTTATGDEETEELKKLKGIVSDTALSIYKRYISLESKLPLGFPSSVRHYIENSICDPEGVGLDCFERAQSLTFEFMEENFYESFFESSIFKGFIIEVKEEDSLKSETVTPPNLDDIFRDSSILHNKFRFREAVYRSLPSLFPRSDVSGLNDSAWSLDNSTLDEDPGESKSSQVTAVFSKSHDAVHAEKKFEEGKTLSNQPLNRIRREGYRRAFSQDDEKNETNKTENSSPLQDENQWSNNFKGELNQQAKMDEEERSRRLSDLQKKNKNRIRNNLLSPKNIRLNSNNTSQNSKPSGPMTSNSFKALDEYSSPASFARINEWGLYTREEDDSLFEEEERPSLMEKLGIGKNSKEKAEQDNAMLIAQSIIRSITEQTN